MKRKAQKPRTKRRKNPELDAIEAIASRIKAFLKAPTDARSILPGLFTSPAFFAAVAILPQIALFFMNAHAYSMVRRAEGVEHGLFAALFISEAALVAVMTAFPVVMLILKKRIAWGFHWIFLACGIAFLWFVTSSMDALIPRSVENWIVPRGELLYLNFLCVMPVIFYSLIRLSAISIPVAPAMQMGIIGGTTVAIPLGWYLCAITLFRHANLSDKPITYIVAGAMVASTAALFFGLFRALVFFIRWYTDKNRRTVSMILAVIVGLIMPLAGLLLNITVPFPADFQRPWFYLLAVLTGAVRIVPRTDKRMLATILFFARCVLFSYTAYFFLVFLPFYPLAVPLVFAFGAGFLVLTPALLFVIHGKRILDEYRSRKGWRTITLAAASVLVIPSLVTGIALVDRMAIHGALTHVYRPDLAKTRPYGQSKAALARALENLNELNNGHQVPFVSGWYSRIVFNGLTLSDTKTDTLYRLFTGKPLPPAKNRDRFGDFFFNVSPRSVLESMAQPVVENPAIAPRIDVTQTRIEKGYSRSTVRFTLRNRKDTGLEEYRTAIALPDGVFIGGYRLRIGNTNVSGRITEKKTALWIYAMITSRQRDPGVLYYRGPNEAVLRVFPFTGNETRVTEIDFIHPAGVSLLSIGERLITLHGGDAPSVMRHTSPNGTAYLIPASVKARLSQIERAPYAYFICDNSVNGPVAVNTRLRSIASQLKVDRFRVCYANYDIHDDGVLRPVSAAASLPKAPSARGGFDVNRAVKHALIDHGQRMASSPNEYRLSYPVIVVITSPSMTNETDVSIPSTNRAKARYQMFLSTDTLDCFERLAPESPYYYVSAPGERTLARVSFGRAAEKVILIAAGREIHAVPSRSTSVIPFQATNAIAVFNEKKDTFTPLASAECGPSAYASALEGMSLYLRGRFDPSRAERDRKPLLALSKASGIMLPTSAYIVVETFAQNRMIDEMEKKKMSTVNEADIAKSPEPPLIALIICAIALVILSSRRRAGVRVPFYGKGKH